MRPAAVTAILARGAAGGLSAPELQALASHARDLLRRGPGDDGLVLLLRDLAAAVTDAPPLARSLACRRGCTPCCHQHVTAHAVELFAIARRLRAPVPPPRAPACAMLAGDGACTIHAERPFGCRMFVSTDAAACARAFAPGSVTGLPPGAWPRPVADTLAWALMAVWAAQQALGLPVRAYAFVPALAAVVADPGLEHRWYAGDDGLAAFAGPEDLPHPAMLAAAGQLAREAGLMV